MALAIALGARPAAAFVEVTGEEAPEAEVFRPEAGALDEGGGTGRPERRMDVEAGEPLTLAANRLEVAIRDGVALVRVEQVFQNNTDRTLQARYVMPLGDRAHVTSYAIWEEGVRVEGELMEVSRAEDLYREVTRQELETSRHVYQEPRAVRIARDPGILRQLRPERFETHIYPILPWSLKQMEVAYAESVAGADGWSVWGFPMEAAQVFVNPVGELQAEVLIEDAAGVGEVRCGWPGADLRREAPGRVRVHVAGQRVRPAGPLEVRWRSCLAPLEAAFLAHRMGAGPGHALVRVALPAARDAVLPLDVVLAVDTSGSMGGPKGERAGGFLERILGALGPRDRAAVVRFADRARVVRPLAPIGEVGGRLGALLAVPAEGQGTLLSGALRAAFALAAEAAQAGRRRLVVLCTDGVTTEPTDEVLDAVEPDGTRLLVVGTGHDDDLELLVPLAERHGGAVWVPGSGVLRNLWNPLPPDALLGPYGEAIADGEAADPAPLVAALGGAAVTALGLEGLAGAGEVYPPVHPALAAGGTASFLLRYEAGAPVRLRLRGLLDGVPLEREYALRLPAEEPAHRFVEDFWAKARVEELLRRNPPGPGDPHRAEVVRLSLAHRFVTPYTAFLSLPDMERRRLLLGPTPVDDTAERYRYAGAAPEGDALVLALVGVLVAVLVLRPRATPRREVA
ncbi:MAG: VWA domain-containing protein [Planctomycetes bacterium]|nr:VWA domain-containing protein [Planctomycetota bacterium]